MEEIQYIGVNELDDNEKEVVDKLSAEYYDKIKRELKNITSLKIHIKTYQTAGGVAKKKKFSINVRQLLQQYHSIQTRQVTGT